MPINIQINRELFKGIFTLITGTAAAQLLAILLQPFLRRMFSPEDFGAYAVYLSATAILVAIGTLRYEPAIVQPSRKADAINLFFLAFYINLLFCLLLTVAMFFFHVPLAEFLNLSKNYAAWLLFIPVSVFLLGTYQCMNYYLIRGKAFRAISINKGIRRMAEGTVQLTAGKFRFAAGLVLGDLAGHLANVSGGFIQMKRHGFSLRLHSFPRQKALARQYADYPLYYMGPMLLNILCLMLPTLFINKFFSQEIAGYFDLSRLVLVIPAALLTMSVGQVFLQNITEKSRMKLDLRKDFLQLLWVLIIIAAFKAIILSLAGPWLMGVYAGAPYEEAGRYVQILVWGSAVRTVVSPLSMIFVGLRKLKAQAVWQAGYFLMICSLPLFSHLGVMTFITILAGIEIVAYSINLGLGWNILMKYQNHIKNG